MRRRTSSYGDLQKIRSDNGDRMILRVLLLDFFEGNVLTKLLRILLKLKLASNFLLILSGVIYLFRFFVSYNSEVVLDF